MQAAFIAVTDNYRKYKNVTIYNINRLEEERDVCGVKSKFHESMPCSKYHV